MSTSAILSTPENLAINRYNILAGVYMLTMKKKVVHISHSENMLRDVYSHDAKAYDGYVIMECKPHEMIDLELELRDQYLPNEDKDRNIAKDYWDYCMKVIEGEPAFTLFVSGGVALWKLNSTFIYRTSVREDPENSDYSLFKGFKGLITKRKLQPGEQVGQILVEEKFYDLFATDNPEKYDIKARPKNTTSQFRVKRQRISA